MICKTKKNKFICVFCSFLILVFGLLQSSTFSFNSYASETMSVYDYLDSINFYDACAYVYRKVGSFPDNIGGGTVTFALFEQYLEDKGNEEILQQPVTSVEGASGGRGYELPQNVRQEMINFINTNIVEAEPLSYTGAYIYSYKFLNPSNFQSYNTYSYVQELIKNNNGYTFISAPNGWNGNANDALWIMCVPRSYSLSFIGEVLGGSFSNVGLAHDWSSLSTLPIGTEGIKYYYVNQAGYSEELPSNHRQYWGPVKNVSSPQQSGSAVFTNYNKNEYVYVFNTLQALRNYNSGLPQPYYILSDPNYVAPQTDIITSSDLDKAGNFYNSIVNNVNTGETPEETQKTVKNGLMGLLSGLTGGVGDVPENTTGESIDLGFLGSIKAVVLGVTGAIEPAEELINNDLKRFVTDTFGWIPEELIVFWTAGIIFAVFFGILKIVRG